METTVIFQRLYKIQLSLQNSQSRKKERRNCGTWRGWGDAVHAYELGIYKPLGWGRASAINGLGKLQFSEIVWKEWIFPYSLPRLIKWLPELVLEKHYCQHYYTNLASVCRERSSKGSKWGSRRTHTEAYRAWSTLSRSWVFLQEKTRPNIC